MRSATSPSVARGPCSFFHLMSYERAATVLTSNKGFEEWGEVFGDDVMAGALIDRLVHHCHIVNIGAIATASGPTASCSRSSGPHPHPPPRPSAGLAARRPGRPRLVPPRGACHFPRRFCAFQTAVASRRRQYPLGVRDLSLG